MKTYSIEVFDKRDAYGFGMPVLQLEATGMIEAYEAIMESLGFIIEVQSK